MSSSSLAFSRPRRSLVLLAMFALATACGDDAKPGGDAGLEGDAGTDAGPSCVPAAEVCNQRDDDCDELVDEDNLGEDATVCDCNGGVPPTSITLRYPAIVQSGVPAQLEVQLEGASGPLDCNPGVVITTSDAAAVMPTEPLMVRYQRLLFPTALVTGPTQSITVTVGGVSATKTGISVVTDRHGVEPAVTRIEVPAVSRFSTIPTTNTVADDAVLEGGITLGDTLYFFASNGLGPKLYSYSVAEGVRQRSNTNLSGPDHAWVGGFRALGGAIYFNAFTTAGCLKIFRYVPGDPMVTRPIGNTNPKTCVTLPTQVGTLPSDEYGVGSSGSLRATGDDTPWAARFDPVEVEGRIYFVASTGRGYEVFEYTPGGALAPVTDFFAAGEGTSPQNLFLLGTESGKLVFVGPNGTYEHVPGGPQVTDPVSPDGPDVPSELASGVRLGSSIYFVDDDARLARYTLGEPGAVEVSDTGEYPYDDAPADLSVVDGKIAFSALDENGRRNIYLHDPTVGGVTTTPIPDPCGGGCTDPSQPIGMLGSTFYFNARRADRSLGFFHAPWGGGAASAAFTVNTSPMDDIVVVATVDGAVYYLGYEGYLGELDRGKYPLFGADRGDGRFGYGRRQLYVLPDGRLTPVQAFDTVDTDEADESASGTKHPSGFTVVGNSVYFLARGTGTHPGGEFVQHLYHHVPGQSGPTTAAIDDGIRVAEGNRIAIGGRLYFLGDVANDPGAPRWKLFSHAPGEGQLSPSDAITDLVPGGSDEITRLANVGGVLVFVGRDAAGHRKLYRYRPGDGVLGSDDAVSDLVPTGDDAITYNAADVLGGDSSVHDGRLWLVSSSTRGFVYDPTSNAPLTATDAVTIAAGTGELLVRHADAYYLVPEGSTVVDGIVYGNGSGGPGVEYARKGRPIAETNGQVEYFRISSNMQGPVEYLRLCDAWGFHDRMIDGVYYFFAYVPGTEVCAFHATTPTHVDFPEYITPFPSLGIQDTQYGPTGAAWPLEHDAARGVTFVRGGISHDRARPRVSKAFAFRDGVLTLLSPSRVGNDRTNPPFLAGDVTYVSVDRCGGRVDFDRGSVGASCSRLVRITP